VDWLSGAVRLEGRRRVRSAADLAACGVALTIASAMRAEVLVVAMCDAHGEAVLRDVLAEGAHRAVRLVAGEDVDTPGPAEQWGSEVAAAALAAVLGDADVIVCGDASGDRGSGTVPARLAHLLGRPQALGCRAVRLEGSSLRAVRRLDGGRRERLGIDPPCVVSVEAGIGPVPRAALARVLGGGPAVERVAAAVPPGSSRGDPTGAVTGPWRPRASDVPVPGERDPVLRAVALTGALERSDPPEFLRAAPDAAAAGILERLERWGLL
jgi:electron transfer flavoprotein beta subunit